MRSVDDVDGIPVVGQKFFCPFRRDAGPFVINTQAGSLRVTPRGQVLDPQGAELMYQHTDTMSCEKDGFTGTVKDFLTVDPSMDTPGSINW